MNSIGNARAWRLYKHVIAGTAWAYSDESWSGTPGDLRLEHHYRLWVDTSAPRHVFAQHAGRGDLYGVVG